MTLADKLRQSFPAKIHFPTELNMLCDWVEKNGYASILTDFMLHSSESSINKYFDNGHKIAENFAVFGHSGDGGIFAIWESENEQKIVHLGSEGSNWFIVARNFLDFLNILAIGYPHLASDHLQIQPPQSNINDNFKNWVKTTFNLKVPNSAKNLINKSDKTFTKWLFENLQPGVTFEHFDPDNEKNKQLNSIEYRLLVTKVPDSKSKFIGDLRKVSTMSISELSKQLNYLPFIVYQNSTYFKGHLSLKNFPTPDKDYLIYLTTNYKSEIILEYRNNVRQSEKSDYKPLL